MPTLNELLDQSSGMHHHLCPRQVLGVRMGLLAGRELGLTLPQTDKRLLTMIETDGCFADGVSVATGCWVGHRTLRVEDYGKVAATFVDTDSGQTLRIVPRFEARTLAKSYAPEARNRWEAQLLGYQRMPVDALFVVQPVELTHSVESIVSSAGLRAVCESCGEEIINGRQIVRDGKIWCRACLFGAYYTSVTESSPSVALEIIPK